MYTSNDYSFYVSDDIKLSDTIFYTAPGDSLDYIIKAIKAEDRQLIESYKEGYLEEVILNDNVRQIFTDTRLDVPRASLAVKFSSLIIWIVSPEIVELKSLNIYFSIVDAISFWLAECRDIIESTVFFLNTIVIRVVLSGDINDYEIAIETTNDLDKAILYSVEDNVIEMVWTPMAYNLISPQTNSVEKVMISHLLKQLNLFANNYINLKKIDEIFENPYKKKFFSLDYISTPYLKPISESYTKIHNEDENALLDDIGNHILQSGTWEIGIIDDKDRMVVANKVVEYLYSLLVKTVVEINRKGFFEQVCLDLEISIYHLMLAQKRYHYDISCYPEKADKLQNQFNELNKSSRALKFLMEYIASTPPNGKNMLGRIQYDKLLAICSLIIDWAYRNDLFYYNIFKTPVEFLNSGRIGMKRDEYDVLAMINSRARERQLSAVSNPSIDLFFPNNLIPELQDKINDAYLDEYGYSFEQFTYFIFAMLEYGDTIKSDVKYVDVNTLINQISQIDKRLDYSTTQKILSQISLTKRDDFLNPGKPYRKEDVYPWRFNRDLSFTRRPIVIVDDIAIWGNRHLYHMWVYMIDLIIDGKLKTRNRKLSTLIGKLSDKRGDEFNILVVEKLNSIEGINAYSKVSKINKLRICSDEGNTYGDIDVLYIIPAKKKIVVGEVKDFGYARSPYEMYNEYLRMFVDTDKKLSFASKHKRRVDWIKMHIEDVKLHYGLSGDKWKVKDIFIVNQEIVSSTFYKTGHIVITYSEITDKRMKSI